ncbi:MAG: GNAT family N-acetyltransferase [Gemmatimonadaceae bacterium]
MADADTISMHRASMFEDMGTITSATAPALRNATREYMLRAVPTEEYVGWLMFEVSRPDIIVAGAGMLLRQIPPFPIMHGVHAGTLGAGKQGLILNVYVDRAWRRKGLAAKLMRVVMEYANEVGVENLVLHASNEGRPLYEQLGFVATNEMRLVPT